MKRVLPVGCFHVVFTLPAQLRPLARRHPREMYDLLFRAAADTLLALGRTPRHLGAELGITSVPHTCNRQLEHHPHVHCICTAGGLSPDGTRWVACRPNLLFPVKAMGKLMRGRFLDGLMRLRKSGRVTDGLSSDDFSQLIESLYDLDWNVYSKAPFAGPKDLWALGAACESAQTNGRHRHCSARSPATRPAKHPSLSVSRAAAL